VSTEWRLTKRRGPNKPTQHSDSYIMIVTIVIFVILIYFKPKHCDAGKGEISKQKQLKEKKCYGTVQDFSFYETRLILKFSFKHCLMKELKIF
jgi:hypothetical protein